MKCANLCLHSIALVIIALFSLNVHCDNGHDKENHLFDRIYNRDTIVSKCEKPIPGFDWMQYGYDIREIDIFRCPNIGGTRRRIFNLNECTNDEHFELKEANETYHKPDNLNIYNRPREVTEDSVDQAMMDHEHSIRRFLSHSVKKDAAIDAGMFTASETYNYLNSRLGNVYTTIVRKIRVYYELALPVDMARRALLSSFVAALQRLPLSYEEHKDEYIDFINHYGTHYIHNVQIGGFVQKTSFLPQNDYKTATRSEAIAKTFQYNHFDDSTAFESCSDQELLRNRRYFSSDRKFEVEYFGGNMSFLDKRDKEGYDEWWASLPHNPAIVNIHLFPISHFFTDRREKQMEIAIREYAMNKYERESMKTCAKPLSHHDRFEHGWDATAITLFDCPHMQGMKEHIFDFVKCEQEKQWTFNQQTYDIADAYDAYEEVDEWTKQGTLLRTIEDIRNDSESVSIEEENSRGLFADSGAFRYYQNQLANASIVITRQFKQYYIVQVNETHAKRSVSDNFEKEVYELPKNFDQTPLPYIEFIKKFGTHYISKAFFGGLVKRITIVAADDEEAARLANGQFPIVKRAAKDFINCRGKNSLKMIVADKFFNYDLMEEQYYGGNPEQIDQMGSFSWMASIPLNPHLISVDLKLISTLLPSDKGQHLEKAIKAYMARAHLEEVTRTAENKINLGNLISSEFADLFKQVNEIRKENIYDEKIIDAVAMAISGKTNSASGLKINIIFIVFISLIVARIAQ